MGELTKKERKALAHEQKMSERSSEYKKSRFKKFLVWVLIFAMLGGGVYWMYRGLTKPLPGQLYPDLGQEHVNDISGVEYNSNPPTSGTHFPVWAKNGVYDRMISDGYLIHSLEHGYIVISYDCTKPVASNIFSLDTYAQEINPVENTTSPEATGSGEPLTKMTVFPTDKMSWVTPESAPGEEVELPEEFSSDACKSLVAELTEYPSEWDRVVVIPRVGMDYPIALTAWRRLLTLDSVNNGKIEEFIKSYHNMGPEKTME